VTLSDIREDALHKRLENVADNLPPTMCE